VELSSNLTLELFNQPFLLEKRIQLLFAIEKTGSISKASKEVPMSYKSAWEAVESMNNLSSKAIVLKSTGGKGGGGTHLTDYGQKLLQTYTILKEEQRKFLQKLQNRTDIESGTLKSIERLSMQISARNQIQTVVKKISNDKVNTKLELKLKSDNQLSSIITNGARETLNIEVGNEVMAIFKSSSVLLVKKNDLQKTYINQLEGFLKKINISEINVEVILDMGQSESLVSVMKVEDFKSLNLSLGEEVVALIQPNDIMIGK